MKPSRLLIYATCALAVSCSVVQAQQPTREEARKIARRMLNSPNAKYLSEGGRNALQKLAAEESGAPVAHAQRDDAIISELFTRLAPAANGEVLVNDPDQDLYTAFDVSTQTQPAVAAFGRLVVAAYVDSGTTFPGSGSDSYMGYSRSLDGGATFTDLGKFPAGPYGEQNFGLPGMTVDRAGRFFTSSIVNAYTYPYFGPTVGVYRSTDAGMTWPVLAFVPPGTNSIYGITDKPFITADTSNSRFSGSIYVSYSGASYESPGMAIFVSRSIDGGQSFHPSVMVSGYGEAAQGSEPAVGPQGELYVTWLRMDTTPKRIMFARSLNGGLNFEPPVAVAALNDIGFETGVLSGGFRVNSFPRIDVNPLNGNIYIVYSGNPPGPDGADVYMVTSSTRGRSWSQPVRINTDVTLNDQFHPDVAVNAVGAVDVIWYDRRNDTRNSLIEVYRARVSPDGQHVLQNEKLSSEAFPPAPGFDPTFIPQYMGDYIDFKAVMSPLGRAFGYVAAWGDSRRQIVTPGGRRHD